MIDSIRHSAPGAVSALLIGLASLAPTAANADFENGDLEAGTITGTYSVGGSEAQHITGADATAMPGWEVDSGYMVNAAWGTSGGLNQLMWIGETGLSLSSCLEQPETGLISGMTYQVCFDIASASPYFTDNASYTASGDLNHSAVFWFNFFDTDTFGVGSIDAQDYVTGYSITSIGAGGGGVATTSFSDPAMLYTLGTSTNALDTSGGAYDPTSSSAVLDWSTLNWYRICIEIDADPNADGNMYFDFSQNAGSPNEYFAIDNLSIQAVPEPGTMTLLGCAGLGFLARLRRRRKARTA